MSSQELEIRSYLQHDSVSGDLVLHTSNGIVLIRDQRMKDFLRDTEMLMRRQIAPSEIEKWFGADATEAISFLKQYSVLREKRPFNFHVGEVSFVTNCGEVGRIVNSTMSPDVTEWSYLEFDDDTSLMDKVNGVAGKDVMLSVFLNPYSRRLATLIRDAILRAPNTILLMSYTYNNCLYIDSFYQSQWRVPCHLCQINQIKADLRLRVTGAVTYQQIVDQLYDDDSSVDVHTPLTARRSLHIADRLVHRIDRFVTLRHADTILPEDCRYAYMLDLNTMLSLQDITTHWEMCDCYE